MRVTRSATKTAGAIPVVDDAKEKVQDKRIKKRKTADPAGVKDAPNIEIFTKGPTGKDAEYEAIIASQIPGRRLRWVAQMADTKIVCSGPNKKKCKYPLQRVPLQPTDSQLKRIIVVHRNCVHGVGRGPKAPFPVQKSKQKK